MLGRMATQSTRNLPSRQKGMRERIWDVLLDLVPEAVTTVGLLGIVGLSRYLLQCWLGRDAKFFDYLPVEWVFDRGI